MRQCLTKRKLPNNLAGYGRNDLIRQTNKGNKMTTSKYGNGCNELPEWFVHELEATEKSYTNLSDPVCLDWSDCETFAVQASSEFTIFVFIFSKNTNYDDPTTVKMIRIMN